MNTASKHGRRPHSPAVALVETSDPYSTVVECVPLVEAGYDVVVCGGSRADQLCPVLDGLPCPLIREADVVINVITDPTMQAAVAGGLHRVAPDVVIYRDIGRAVRHLRGRGSPRCVRERQPAVTVFP